MRRPATGVLITVCIFTIFAFSALPVHVAAQQAVTGARERAGETQSPQGPQAPSSPSSSQPSTQSRGADGSRTGRLPVRRVVLYKNGIGYFEHLGRVTGKFSTTVPRHGVVFVRIR